MCLTFYPSKKKEKEFDEFLMKGEKGEPRFLHKASGSAKLQEYSIVFIWLGAFRKHGFHILFSALRMASRLGLRLA